MLMWRSVIKVGSSNNVGILVLSYGTFLNRWLLRHLGGCCAKPFRHRMPALPSYNHLGVDSIWVIYPKGPSPNIIRTLGFYIGIYYYGLGQVLNI